MAPAMCPQTAGSKSFPAAGPPAQGNGRRRLATVYAWRLAVLDELPETRTRVAALLVQNQGVPKPPEVEIGLVRLRHGDTRLDQ